ncbi:MAG: PAS domain S-box protein, partial [Chloroflexota bacterium]
PQETETGEPSILVIAQDIDARKRAEAALKASEERYRTLVENAPVGICSGILAGRPIFRNQTVVQMYGYDSVEEMLKAPAQEYYYESKDRERMLKLLGEQGVVRDLEVRHKRKDGSPFWVSLTVVLQKTEAGEPALLMVVQDIAERKRAEEALKASEERYRALVENAPVGISITTVAGRSVFHNQMVTQLHGYDSIEEFLKVPARERYHDSEDRRRFLALIGEQGLVRDFEVRLKRKDGSAFWGSLTAVPQETETGEPSILVIAQDIDARKRAEAALKASEERYRALVENAPVGIGITTLDGRAVVRNKATAEIHGYESTEEFLKVPGQDLYYDPKDRERLVALIKESGLVKDLETRHRRKDGSVFWVSSTHIPVTTENGEPAILAIVQDIDARKQAEDALKTSEERYRALVENAPVGIGLTTLDGRAIFRNKSVTLMHGYESAGEFMKVPAQERYYDVNDRERLLKLLREQGLVRSLEIQHKRKDGSVFWVSITAIPQQTETGEPGVLMITQDIDTRKRAEEETQRGLERLRKAMGDTIQAMAHISEVRDPYTAGHQRRVAQLSTEIAKELGFSGEQLEAIRVIALIHDIGKIHVPAEILSKPGKLSELEYSMIKSHCQVGYEILKTIDFPWPVAQIVLQHHERLDGSGYPAGLHGNEISPEARILAVADVVEAMSSHRPYRASQGVGEALKEIQAGKGTLYDADVVDACVRLFTERLFNFTAL